MPRKAYNVSRQRTRGNAITINGLLTWRARRLRALRLQEGDAAAIEADIAALDRVLVNVLGYTGDIEADTRDFRRDALFRRNELRKMVADVLRQANRPLTARQIAQRVITAKGLPFKPGKQSKAWITRVRVVCRKLPNVQMTRADDGSQAWGRQEQLVNK